ncbi:choice-of-anchor J domain-containing protein [Cyclobacterium sp.]|uniref:T9SS-dependent choice-of-anchor J family protein n=1 Tax=Cyclobacterium sp. TaxID=1966343 RepID=UPI0019BED9F0|nr:choice-of-anchor J domain-containing protein [Cyclobacterium sp.]MBD3627328.1 T9SS type A sorting domain-containing protein [Cyclobacterium sp.]
MYLLYFFLVFLGKITFSNLREVPAIPTPNSNTIQENFNRSCTKGLPPGWAVYGLTGNQTWTCTTYGHKAIQTDNGISYALQINGYAGKAEENESWLISPVYDLSHFQFPLLSFYSRVAFDGPRPQLFISTDYEEGDPNAGTWTALGDRFARGDHWTHSGKINLASYKSKMIRLALVYFSSPEKGAARWTIDDWTITNADQPPAPFLNTNLENTAYMHFETVQAGQSGTDLKSFEFLLSDPTGELTIRVNEGFGISKTQNGFSQQLSYTAEEAVRNNTLWIRFEPQTEGAFHGPVSFSFADSIQQVSFLSGSTINQEETLDIVTWNIAWFGSDLPYQGPEDPGRQLENVSQLIRAMDADIYALQEITNLDQFQKLVASLEGYEAEISPAASYGASDFDAAQKLAFLYKTSTVIPITSRVLLQGVTSEDIGHYPAEPNRFWASGRLPFLMEAETRVGGIQQTLSLVNLHARSNGGGESAANPRYAMRKFDATVLKDSLDQYYGTEALLILGDLNDDLDKTIADTNAFTVSGSETSFIRFMLDKENYFPATLVLTQAGLRSYILSDNIIDHIILSNELAESYLSQSARIVVPEDGIANFLNNTSDHLPVKIRLDLKKNLANNLILGLPEEINTSGISIYPNPVNQTLFVRLKEQKHQVSLINPMGKIIQTRSGQDGMITFDVSMLPRGLYLLHITREESRNIYKKIIVR